jgi:hypothetical protein
MCDKPFSGGGRVHTAGPPPSGSSHVWWCDTALPSENREAFKRKLNYNLIENDSAADGAILHASTKLHDKSEAE